MTARLMRLVAAGPALSLILAGFVAVVAPTSTPAAGASPAAPNVVPSVQQWSAASDDSPFVLQGRRPIVYDDARLRDVAQLLSDEIRDVTGMSVRVIDRPVPRPVPGGIFLSRTAADDVRPEGYELSIGDAVRIEGTDVAGVFYGTRTLLQLLKQGGEARNELPRGTVTDAPQYPVRALMLDTARKFFSVDFLKQYVRQMAWLKMNVLHLHLSDDEAFRLESDVPGLTSPQHYTKAEIAELVAFARRHHVTIVPEIEAPSHAASILEARPDLGHQCDTMNDIRREDTGQLRGILDLSNPDTVPFIKSLIDEYLPMFDGVFHFGTDEYPLSALRTQEANREFLLQCAELAAKADDLGYADPGDIFRDFTDEITRYIEDNGGQAWAWTWHPFIGSKPLQTRPVMDAWVGTDVRTLSEDGHGIINSTPNATYIMPGRRVLNRELLYESWQSWQWYPTTSDTTLDPGDPNLLGVKANVWNPPAWTPAIPEGAIDRELSSVLKVLAEKNWGGPHRASYDEFVSDTARVGNAPGYGFGLLANYRFERSEHSAAGDDTSGAGVHGDLYGPELADGRNGTGLRFDGGDDRMHLGAPDVSGEWTASLWVKRRASGQDTAILLDSDRFSIRLEQTGTERVGITEYGSGAKGRGDQADHSFDYAAPVDTWVHLTLVGEQATTSLYVDGELIDTLDRGFSMPLRYLGAESDAFAGTIDDVKVHDSALAAAAVRSLHSGLVVNYSFEETEGVATVDVSGLGNNGARDGAVPAEGHGGQGLRFNGGDDMVYTSMPRGITDQWTVSTWLSGADNGQAAEVLMSSEETGYSLLTRQWKTGTVGFSHTGDPSHPLEPPVHDSWEESFDYTLPADGNWRHVTFVGDARGTSLYVDGDLVDTSPRRIELPMQFVGVKATGSNAPVGTLDELRIFDRALTPDEIRETFEAQAYGTYLALESGLRLLPGESEQVALILRNDGPDDLDDVEVEVEPPDGWQADASFENDTVQVGEAIRGAFNVVAAEDAPLGSTQEVTVTVSYDRGGQARSDSRVISIPVGENIALGQSVEASSVLSSNVATNAVNGVVDGARWISAADDPLPTLTIDLSTPVDLRLLRLYSGYKDAPRFIAREVLIDAYVDDEWVEVGRLEDNTASPADADLTGAPPGVQRVRLRFTDPGTADDLARIFEVEIYGTRTP